MKRRPTPTRWNDIQRRPARRPGRWVDRLVDAYSIADRLAVRFRESRAAAWLRLVATWIVFAIGAAGIVELRRTAGVDWWEWPAPAAVGALIALHATAATAGRRA